MRPNLNWGGVAILTLGALAVLATLLSLLPGPHWWLRLFDYPRAQVAGLCLLTLMLSLIFLRLAKPLKVIWLVLLSAALLYQLSRIIVYTPLYPKQVLPANQVSRENSFNLLIANVLMGNRDAAAFLNLVRRHRPDIILINEPDAWWERQLRVLDSRYQYHLKQPQSNTYGMILYSRLPLKEKELNFLVEQEVPSVYAQVQLPSGDIFDFYGLHPRPPKPGTDTYERDAEILLVGRRVRERGRPAVVAGDLNDVAWSSTSALFQRYSGLLDPRHGRGMYNTFNAKLPLLRYPLDHVFFSSHFGLIRMVRLENFGSDHFPILVSLSYEPQTENAQNKPRSDGEDRQKADRRIRKGR